MFKKIIASILTIVSTHAFAWGVSHGAVEVLHVNTFGNFADAYLDGGFCFKLKGQDRYLKIAFSETGEKRKNHDFVQTLVLATYMSGKQLRAQYVDFGAEPTCRVNGAAMPAYWLEDLQVVN